MAESTRPKRRLTENPEYLSLLRQRNPWKLRVATEPDDGCLLEEWIAADPYHAGRTTARDWLAPRFHVTNLLGFNDDGPLLFLRLTNEMCEIPVGAWNRAWRIDIQFAPAMKIRTAKALASGCAWLAEKARKLGYAFLLFESGNPPLIRFMERAGFRKFGGIYVLPL